MPYIHLGSIGESVSAQVGSIKKAPNAAQWAEIQRNMVTYSRKSANDGLTYANNIMRDFLINESQKAVLLDIYNKEKPKPTATVASTSPTPTVAQKRTVTAAEWDKGAQKLAQISKDVIDQLNAPVRLATQKAEASKVVDARNASIKTYNEWVRNVAEIRDTYALTTSQKAFVDRVDNDVKAARYAQDAALNDAAWKAAGIGVKQSATVAVSPAQAAGAKLPWGLPPLPAMPWFDLEHAHLPMTPVIDLQNAKFPPREPWINLEKATPFMLVAIGLTAYLVLKEVD